jgi:hypothetical protein
MKVPMALFDTGMMEEWSDGVMEKWKSGVME